MKKQSTDFNYLLRNMGGNSGHKITPQAENFPKWYQDVVIAADLAENGPSKGSMIIKPYGYAIWERLKEELDERIKAVGVPNMYFPLFIPERLLHKEASHIEGFSPEVAVVTHAGGAELEEKLVVRPTSETIMYDSFSRWVQSYRDLPLLVNQWANVVRWEMRPRMFLRTTEFLWQEGHTAHATADEADEFAKTMLEMYKDVIENVLGIPTISGAKSSRERFAGADQTYTLEPMMGDGKALQFATSHNLGENFSKAFGINYSAEDGSTKNVWQTSWGMSTRAIGGIIMSHGDDRGLVLPPKLAPLQVVIVTVGGKIEAVEEMARVKADEISATTLVDDRDMRPGEKFFEWEKRGVPIRIEIGPRYLESSSVVLVRRDTGQKTTVSLDELPSAVENTLTQMQSDIFASSKKRLSEKTIECDDIESAISAVLAGNFSACKFKLSEEDETMLKDKHGITVRCYPFEMDGVTIIAKAY